MAVTEGVNRAWWQYGCFRLWGRSWKWSVRRRVPSVKISITVLSPCHGIGDISDPSSHGSSDRAATAVVEANGVCLSIFHLALALYYMGSIVHCSCHLPIRPFDYFLEIAKLCSLIPVWCQGQIFLHADSLDSLSRLFVRPELLINDLLLQDTDSALWVEKMNPFFSIHDHLKAKLQK